MYSFYLFTVLLWLTAITGSLLISAALPLFYELVCELTYPIAEGVTNGLLTCLNNVSGLVFFSFIMIKPLGEFNLFSCLFNIFIYMWRYRFLMVGITFSIPIHPRRVLMCSRNSGVTYGIIHKDGG